MRLRAGVVCNRRSFLDPVSKKLKPLKRLVSGGLAEGATRREEEREGRETERDIDGDRGGGRGGRGRGKRYRERQRRRDRERQRYSGGNLKKRGSPLSASPKSRRRFLETR